jgi:hypothetical protein
LPGGKFWCSGEKWVVFGWLLGCDIRAIEEIIASAALAGSVDEVTIAFVQYVVACTGF